MAQAARHCFACNIVLSLTRPALISVSVMGGGTEWMRKVVFFFFEVGWGEGGDASRFERGVEAGMSELSELEENTDEKLRRMPS